MSKTIDDIERDITLALLMERAGENEQLARSALQMCAVLVLKLGGEVEVHSREIEQIAAYNLAQIQVVDRDTVVLRVERRRPN